MKIVCMNCNEFFHPLKNGVTVEEGMPASPEDKRGQGLWLPYKLWKADMLECRTCKTRVISGFGLEPFSEHYKSDYDELKEIHAPIVSFVKDCL